MTDLAAAHGMEVFEIRGLAFGDREVVLSPKGVYSEAAEQSVKQAFYEQAAKIDQNVKVEVIPF